MKKGFEKVLKEHPYLTDNGTECYSKDRESGRQWLIESEDMFDVCVDCLRRMPTIKTPYFNSYYLKHVVEGLTRKYVTNGAFIAAVIHCKIPYKYWDGSPNIIVAISKRYIHTLEDKHGGAFS